ncbi:tRNA-dihydrouridine synthase [Candidatus Aerophobetes bacterium]|nr:tRNA-dihydrouridine synthase [Candidatus Aerophobetes bacterium]
MEKISQIDLSTTLAGVKMRSSLGVSPHNLDKPWFPGTKAAELFKKYIDAGAGFIYIPAIVPGEPSKAEKNLDFTTLFENQQYVGRWLKVKADGKSVMGHIYTAKNLFNFLPWGRELIENIKLYLPPDVPVIAQVLVHDVDPEKWAKHAEKVASLGVYLIELNTGCPVGAMSHIDPRKLPPEAKWGMFMGTAPEILLPVLKAVVEATHLPVGFKLSPEVGYPRMLYVVEESVKVGIRYVVTTHKYFAVAPPDIWNNGAGKFPALDSNCLADFGGPALRLSMYKATALVSKYFPQIDTFAGGGIVSPEHVIEAIMLGASACQTLTGVVCGGIKFLSRTNEWLYEYMKKCGYTKIEDFKGMGLKHLQSSTEAKFRYYVAKPDFKLCTGCGKCAESYCPAITMQEGRPVVDGRYCSCCGMCNFICPVDAFKYVSRG